MNLKQPWMTDALCAETDPDIFFVDKGQSVAPARSICRRCIVRTDCLMYALETEPPYGVWGGLTTAERRAVRDGRAAA